MELDELMQCLIGVGASVGADCKPCLETCIALARQYGADVQDIETATTVGSRIRRCAERMAEGLKAASPAVNQAFTVCCGSTETDCQKGKQE